MKSKYWLLLALLAIGAFLLYKYCGPSKPSTDTPTPDTTTKDTLPPTLGLALPFSVIQNNIINREILSLQEALVLNPNDLSLSNTIKQLELSLIDSISIQPECGDSIKTFFAFCIQCPNMVMNPDSTSIPPIVTYVNCCPKRPAKQTATAESPVWISPIPLPFPSNLEEKFGENCYVYGPIVEDIVIETSFMIGGQNRIQTLKFSQDGVYLNSPSASMKPQKNKKGTRIK
jgi:hypothetical protein